MCAQHRSRERGFFISSKNRKACLDGAGASKVGNSSRYATRMASFGMPSTTGVFWPLIIILGDTKLCDRCLGKFGFHATGSAGASDLFKHGER